MSIRGRVERLTEASGARTVTTCVPYGPEWIDRADVLLEAMPDEQALRVVRALLSEDADDKLACAFTAAVCRGQAFALGDAL